MALSLDGTTGISASGNIVGNNISVPGTLSVGSFSPTTLNAPGNVTGGNILTAGVVSAAGNITGAYILGNGSQLTGVDATQIINGTSNAKVVSSGGNIAVGIGGTANVAVFATTGAFVTGVVSATGNITGSFFIGNGSQLTGIDATAIQNGTANVRTFLNGNVTTSAGGTANVVNVTSAGMLVAGIVSASGNITGNFILGNGSQLTGIDATSIQSGTSNVRVVSSGGNVATGVGGTANVVVVATTGQFVTGVISASGAITTAGDISITGNIVDGAALTISTGSNGNITLAPNGTGVVVVNTDIRNGQANGVGNIGSSTTYFNTVFAKATSAQYADLAEMYEADASYEPGTVLCFGGSKEVEISKISHASTVAGVVSTNPSYIMNAGQSGSHVVTVALTGRVPTQVIGQIKKGDRIVASHLPGIATVLDSSKYEPGCIIGKALEAHEPVFDAAGQEIAGTIEVVVGRV
jgi:hypothetical protein